MEDFRINKDKGKGRSIKRPRVVNADSAYDSSEIRIYNRKRKIKSNIQENRRNRKKEKQGRPKRFQALEYMFRKSVERTFSWLESFKRIATRFDLLEISFLGMLYLASSIILSRVLG